MILVRTATLTSLLYNLGRRVPILETRFGAGDDELTMRPIVYENARNSGHWWEPKGRLVLCRVDGLEWVSDVGAFRGLKDGEDLFTSVPSGV